MTIRITTPVSHLFAESVAARALSDLSDALELRDDSPKVSLPPTLSMLYHCEQSIVRPLDFDQLQRVVDPLLRQERLLLVSLHALSCYEVPPIADGMFRPVGRRMERTEMLHTVHRNVETLSRMYGTDVTIAIENNNYYPTGAYDIVTEASFISELVRTTRTSLLLDVAHARISAHNMGIGPEAHLTQLPLEHAIQIHLSGFATNEPVWRDSHAELSEEQWRDAESCLRRLPDVQFVTLEYYRKADVLIQMLTNLRILLNEGTNKTTGGC